MVLVTLPEEVRGELKEPLGRISKEVEKIKDGRLITVGDVVTYTFLEAGIYPDVSLVDRKTEREKVKKEIEKKLDKIEKSVKVKNQAGTISRDLIEKLDESISKDEKIRIDVKGEEDLATIPAVILANKGDIVVYGQPGEGMVYVKVNDETKKRALDLLKSMKIENRSELEDLLKINLDS